MKIELQDHILELNGEPCQIGRNFFYYPNEKTLLWLKEGEGWRLQEECLTAEDIRKVFSLNNVTETILALQTIRDISHKEGVEENQRVIRRTLGIS